MLLTVTYPVLPKRNSVRASLVMDHFGISPDSTEHVLARDLEVPLQCGDVVLFTGASGSGKSSLLKAVLRQLEVASQSTEEVSPRRHGGTEKNRVEAFVSQPQPTDSPPELSLIHDSPSVLPCLCGESASSAETWTLPVAQPLLIDLPSQNLGTLTLVDAIPLPFTEALQLLAMCGLGEAPLMLRTPQELSEGQRYRFALALAVAHKPRWIVADEFTAVLDRTTAKVIAYNVRRLADRYRIGFILATAQDDIAADLSPDLNVICDLDGRMTVTRGQKVADRNVCTTSDCPPSRSAPRKKKDPRSASTAISGSAPPPVATGRISLGGITAATTSG